jgi:hypothetical protein
MSLTQINGHTQIKAATITDAEIAAAAAIASSKLADGAEFIKRAGTVAFTADQSMGGFLLTNLGTPTAGSDAATKTYVDTVVNGLDWKPSVRAATTAAGTLATSFENGDVIDGVTLATGDRILIKNQATGSENGIYTVNASGAPTRATDADANAEVTAGMAMFVSEGTTNGNTQWALSTDDPITLGTTSLVFSQIGGSTTYTGSNGINVTGTVISPTYGTTANTVCQGNDSRLSDARTPVGTALTGGQLFVGSGSNLAAAVALSGDVASVSNAGAVTLDATKIMKIANYIVRETPTGTINGSNTTFTLANAPVSGTEMVFLNGILQEPGAGNDYTISGATITYLTAPLTGDKIRVTYMK